MARAASAFDSICAWGWEPIDEPRDETEEELLREGICGRRVREAWADPALRSAAERVEMAAFIMQIIARKHEEALRIVATWHPEDARLLPHTLDEYLDELRWLEQQIHRQADETCTLAEAARQVMGCSASQDSPRAHEPS
jgi:hypothetical protein